MTLYNHSNLHSLFVGNDLLKVLRFEHLFFHKVKRLQSVMTSRDLQYKHDLKKKEREANKLKERLHQVLMDKKHERQIGKS